MVIWNMNDVGIGVRSEFNRHGFARSARGAAKYNRTREGDECIYGGEWTGMRMREKGGGGGFVDGW